MSSPVLGSGSAPSKPPGRKPIHDDSFSPIKLPSSTTPSTKLGAPQRLKTHSPANLVVHPHGLTAKHNAAGGNRRNTIHATQRRSLVDTPLSVSSSVSPSRDDMAVSTGGNPHPKYPLTSPRANSKKFNLESIKRSKARLDTRFGANIWDEKENRPLHLSPDKDDVSEEQDSSPIKRNRSAGGSARKIAKVVTSAEVPASPSDHSVQINEVFYKDDLVAQLSSTKSSPAKTASPKQVAVPTVIDNDSDSDPEDYGRIENTISQTLMPNTSTNFNNTQLSKIIKLDAKSDEYITPQRLTEPRAKSPATNQQGRINEKLVLNDEFDEDLGHVDKSDIKDATSPLKHLQHKASESTSNVENARIAEEQDMDSGNEENVIPEAQKLEDEPTINFLMSPNSKPVFSLYQVNKIQDEDKERISKLRDSLKEKESALIQLRQELADALTDASEKEQANQDLQALKESQERNIDFISIQLKHNERELASLTKNFKIKEAIVSSLKTKLNETLAHKEDALAMAKGLTSQVDELTSSNIENAYKAETLAAEKEKLLAGQKELERTSKELSSEIINLKDINAKQEELLNELDNLENLANDKIFNLEKKVQEQVHDLESKANQFNSERDNLVKEFERKESVLQMEISDEKRRLNELSEELKEVQNMNKKLNLKIENLESEMGEIEAKHAGEVKQLQATIDQKESIITEDVAKLNELVEAIEKKKKTYEDTISKYKSDIEALQQESGQENDLKREIEFLQNQLKHQDFESQKKIDEVATFLHKQYAEKHTRKLGEVRDQYEKELSSASSEKKNLLREVESLKRKLNRALEENQKVTEYVHVHKLKYPTSNVASSQGSPKRGRSSRY